MIVKQRLFYSMEKICLMRCIKIQLILAFFDIFYSHIQKIKPVNQILKTVKFMKTRISFQFINMVIFLSFFAITGCKKDSCSDDPYFIINEITCGDTWAEVTCTILLSDGEIGARYVNYYIEDSLNSIRREACGSGEGTFTYKIDSLLPGQNYIIYFDVTYCIYSTLGGFVPITTKESGSFSKELNKLINLPNEEERYEPTISAYCNDTFFKEKGNYLNMPSRSAGTIRFIGKSHSPYRYDLLI